MNAVWGREDPVKAAVLALFSGDPLLGASGKLPFLAGCVPTRLPHLATRDVPSFCAKVRARFSPRQNASACASSHTVVHNRHLAVAYDIHNLPKTLKKCVCGKQNGNTLSDRQPAAPEHSNVSRSTDGCTAGLQVEGASLAKFLLAWPQTISS